MEESGMEQFVMEQFGIEQFVIQQFGMEQFGIQQFVMQQFGIEQFGMQQFVIRQAVIEQVPFWVDTATNNYKIVRIHLFCSYSAAISLSSILAMIRDPKCKYI